MDSLTIAGLVVFILAVYVYRNVGRRPKDFPPGPPTLPILGNLHLMPQEKAHEQFTRWADEYGPIYSLIVGSTVMIVITSDQIVKDLFDKRGNIYSSRPSSYIGDIATNGLLMVAMKYGERWRNLRRLIQNHINAEVSKDYIPYQELERSSMLSGILDRPDRWEDLLRGFTSSSTSQMVFGWRSTSIDDPEMHQLVECVNGLSTIMSSPIAQMVECLPWLRYLPETLLPVKREARKHEEIEHALYKKHIKAVEHAVQTNTAVPCFSIKSLEAAKEGRVTETGAAYISGAVWGAGADTTYATLLGFVKAMILCPDVQLKAQQEIEKVCGQRMPTLEDEPQMQYLRGCVKESLRWFPTLILGFPHSNVSEDMYMGYRIPKEATVVMNIWGIHNNASRYPNPRAFDPSRYANDFQSAVQSSLDPDPSQRDHFSFGAGRRICQGMHIAERALFLVMTGLLWAFNIEAAEDEKGNKIMPDPLDIEEGFLAKPRYFPARFVPRSREKAEAVRVGWEKEVREKLDERGQWRSVPVGER
ncbi:cytochrome P450 [Polyplosphaeria fusca]|uniref:Cytochrome P450 n=1 Tax=Polyplosphaeria fusca TaxID=682080 RepID=A0A9P4QZX6_9PLEO|nr:cytochrome P450 [Polyplosphaeria fusca]